MMFVLAQLFITPLSMGGAAKMFLMLPLCLAIAIVYKATRCERLSELPRAIVVLWATIVVGMFVVGFGLWTINFIFI